MRSARVPPIAHYPTGDWHAAENFQRVPQSAAAARRLVHDTLGGWHLLRMDDRAMVIVTELVSNAINHARGDGMRVSVVRFPDDRVRIGVIDRDRTRPEIKPMTPDQEGGRGLLLIEAMSSVWGVDLLPGGKRVWAELEAS
jgi:serine/threonine-protein kinase RsbW